MALPDWIFERDNIILEKLENTPCKKLGALLVVDARCTYGIWVTRYHHHHHLYLESLCPCELGALSEVDARCTLLTLGGENILEKLYFGLSNQGGVSLFGHGTTFFGKYHLEGECWKSIRHLVEYTRSPRARGLLVS